MNRYAFVRFNYSKPFNKVLVIVDAVEKPTAMPVEAKLSNGFWVDITANPAVQVGWKGTTTNYVDWEFSEPTSQEMEKDVAQEALELLSAAAQWLMLNSLHYKVDLGVATPEEQALLLAYKQYCVGLSDMNKQSGYPSTVNWPVAPF
ncbi:tail fiber assembly protein [Pseudomonas sp. LF-5]|uniref:tail fiber assembly protein n=1 Tax=Pseudomonas TaxID=286 RepID=UPI00309E7EC4